MAMLSSESQMSLSCLVVELHLEGSAINEANWSKWYAYSISETDRVLQRDLVKIANYIS